MSKVAKKVKHAKCLNSPKSLSERSISESKSKQKIPESKSKQKFPESKSKHKIPLPESKSKHKIPESKSKHKNPESKSKQKISVYTWRNVTLRQWRRKWWVGIECGPASHIKKKNSLL